MSGLQEDSPVRRVCPSALESRSWTKETAVRTLLAVLVFLFPLAAVADHDHHHDLGNIGKAHIHTSCSEAAQKEIDRGVAMIHSFWYAPTEEVFRKAAAADPTCGMAWWGVAMSSFHPIWAPPTPAEWKTGKEDVVNGLLSLGRFWAIEDMPDRDMVMAEHYYRQAVAAAENADGSKS